MGSQNPPASDGSNITNALMGGPSPASFGGGGLSSLFSLQPWQLQQMQSIAPQNAPAPVAPLGLQDTSHATPAPTNNIQPTMGAAQAPPGVTSGVSNMQSADPALGAAQTAPASPAMQALTAAQSNPSAPTNPTAFGALQNTQPQAPTTDMGTGFGSVNPMAPQNAPTQQNPFSFTGM